MMAVLHCPNLPHQASFSLATWRQVWRNPSRWPGGIPKLGHLWMNAEERNQSCAALSLAQLLAGPAGGVARHPSATTSRGTTDRLNRPRSELLGLAQRVERRPRPGVGTRRLVKASEEPNETISTS